MLEKVCCWFIVPDQCIEAVWPACFCWSLEYPNKRDGGDSVAQKPKWVCIGHCAAKLGIMKSGPDNSFPLVYLVMFLAIVLSGCTGNRGGNTDSAISPQHQDHPVAVALEIGAANRVYLRYRRGGQFNLATASLPQAPAVSVAGSRTIPFGSPPTIVDLQSAGDESRAELSGSAQAAVHSKEEWQALIWYLARETASLVPGKGFVLDLLSQEELFFFLDDAGELYVSSLEEKPDQIEHGLTLNLRELLVGAFARIHREAPGVDYVLFNSGESLYPFVLLMLADERVVFLRPVSEEVPVMDASAPVYAAQAAIHTLTGQVRSLTTQPFSTITRLVTGLSATVFDVMPRFGGWESTEPPPPVKSALPMDSGEWEQELERLVPGSETSGQIEYLVDGGAYFPALIHAVNAAQESIRIRLYIFDNDDYAVKIADLLKSRSSEIPVEILLDGLGTITGGMAKSEFNPSARVGPVSITGYLRQGSEVSVRMLPNPWLQGDHTKVLIFDETLAFLGGMNIGREYRYEWHDLMVGLRGDIVRTLARDFDLAWSRAGFLGELRTLGKEAGQLASGQSRGSDYPLRLLYTKSGDPQILRTQVSALRRAQQRVWIENAYLTSDVILHELIDARRRGVDVRVILPYRTDSGFIGRSNVLAANLLLRHGVRVYIYPGMSHVKAALYDEWICLGSANFDRLSLMLNKETNIATSQAEAVQGLVDQVFLKDFERSLELQEALPTSWLDHLSELIADQL